MSTSRPSAAPRRFLLLAPPGLLLLAFLLPVLAACAPTAPVTGPRVEVGDGDRPAARTAAPAVSSEEDEDDEEDEPAAGREPTAKDTADRDRRTPTPVPRPRAGGLKTELVADGLQLPANLAFAPDGRLFLTEVARGWVRVIEHGSVLPEPFAVVDEATRRENGLLGLTLDPDFARNRYVYLYYSQSIPDKAKPWRNRIVRFTDVASKGTDMQVVLDDLPIGDKKFNGGHNGGRLAFGPDGKLYVTLGDTGLSESAQDPKLLTGKLLRFNPDGSVPDDNPFPGSPVYASGFRNAWGLAFHPLTGVPYVTENGGTHHDEVNRVRRGGNYGWPKIQGISKKDPKDPRFIDPLWDSYFERGGVAGLTFYTGDVFPQYKDDLLFCTFGTSRLIRLRLAGPDHDRVEQEELLSNQCNLDVLTGPDGAIYFSGISNVQRLVPER
jgi:glucose/arabinose dehydrogenase